MTINKTVKDNVFCQYRNKYCMWDPTLVFNGQYWFLYALTADQEVTGEDYFLVPSYIRGFRSSDLEDWEDIGPVVKSTIESELMCAAMAIVDQGKVYLFYSKTIQRYSDFHLNQLIYLAESEDGRRFSDVDSFFMQPCEKQYATTCFHPETKEMLFAWRDPYVFKDPQSDRYYIYICTGGFRWGVSPNIAVAMSDKITGPYKILPPAIEHDVDENGKDIIPIPELERPQVRFHDGKYYLFLSCYYKHMNPEFIKECEKNGVVISDSCRYQYVSEKADGPYKLTEDQIMILGSNDTGLYCGLFVDAPKDMPSFLVGWDPEKFQIEVRRHCHLVMSESGGSILWR